MIKPFFYILQHSNSMKDWLSIAVSMSGFSVECGWAIGEAVMIPHLLGLRLTPSIAGLVFLVNPIFSVVLGPSVGNCSDRTTRCNRRRPFIIVFSVFACAGFACLVLSSYVADVPQRIALVYAAFGVSDLCHDLMLIPGRALLLDMTLDEVGAAADDAADERADSTYTQVQLMGRLMGLAVVSFPVEEMFATTLRWTHFQTALAFSGVVMVVCVAVVLITSRDRPYDILLSPSMKGGDEWARATTGSSSSLVSVLMDVSPSLDQPFLLGGRRERESGRGSGSRRGRGGGREMDVSPSLDQPFLLGGRREGESGRGSGSRRGRGGGREMDDAGEMDSVREMDKDREEMERRRTDIISGRRLQCSQRVDLAVVLFVTFLFWFGQITFCFWGTSWLGLDTKLIGTRFSLPLVAMATQTLVGILVLNGPLKKMNEWFGRGHVWLLSCVGYMVILSLGGIFLGPTLPLTTLSILSIGGISIACNSSNVYSIVRDIVDDEDSVGWAISMANNMMPIAQILVGGLNGLMVVCPTYPSSNVSSTSFSSSSWMSSSPSPLPSVVCPEIGDVMFWWVGSVGAALIVASYLLDVVCLSGRVFRDKLRQQDRRRKSSSLQERSLLRSGESF